MTTLFSLKSLSVRLGFLVLLSFHLRAEVLWEGDPDQGRAVFDNLNFEDAVRHGPGTGTILPAVDPVHGKTSAEASTAPCRMRRLTDSMASGITVRSS